MSGWFSSDYRCKQCYFTFDKITKKDEKEEPQECPQCQQDSAERIMSIPNNLRHTYHDGCKRDESWQRLKKASKLEREMISKPEKDRQEYRNEISKLKKPK